MADPVWTDEDVFSQPTIDAAAAYDPGVDTSDSMFDYFQVLFDIVSGGGSGDSWMTEQDVTGGGSAAVNTNQLATGAGKVAPPKEEGFIEGKVNAFKNLIGWENMGDRSKAAVITVGGGAIAGMGAGYFKGKQTEATNKIARDRADTEKMLAQSQAAIAEKKSANQDFSKFKYNEPLGPDGKPLGLINRTAKLTPVSQRG